MKQITALTFYTKNGQTDPHSFDSVDVVLPDSYEEFESKIKNRIPFPVSNHCGGVIKFMLLPEGKNGFYHERPKTGLKAYPAFEGETMNYFPVEEDFEWKAGKLYLDENGNIK